MKRTYSDTIPITIEKDGDGSYLYRWDIKEETREMGGDMAPVISYSYNEVRVWSTLTANKILEACIDALWGSGVEQKMLNDYNAAQLGILDLSYVESYKTFLDERKALKDRVDSDFAEWEAAREDESVVVL